MNEGEVSKALNEWEFSKALGEEIKLRRKALKLTADQVSRSAGLHRNNLYRYEQGSSMLVTSLFRVCEALSISTAVILAAVETRVSVSPEKPASRRRRS